MLALEEPPERFSFRLAWSHWRRVHQARAQRAHEQRRAQRCHQTVPSPPGALCPVDTEEVYSKPIDLTESQWRRIVPLLPRPRRRSGRPLADLRSMITAMLWVEASGGSWRTLPPHFGPWQDIYARYHRWRENGLWLGIRHALTQEDSEAAYA